MKVLMHALAASCEELRARTGNPPLKALLHGAIFHATCLAMFKKDLDNALQEVLHAAMIFMQLATIGDRSMQRDLGEALFGAKL
jgi:hypothetical protein